MKRTKLKNTRPKALLGSLINVVGQGINAYGQYQAARDQAAAIERQAQMQADSMLKLNENNNQLQEKLIASQRENNQRMVDAYLNAAMQQGGLNVDNRYRAGRIQVAKGGRLGANRSSLLRGLNNNVEVEGGELIITPNVPPQATDGGQIIPLGQTKDGNIISIAVGSSHEQKHLSINGKREGGVGINVNDETAILSRHTHNGFNPVEAVAQGMTPEDAFQIQENNKIMDRVDYKTPVGRRRLRYAGRPKAAFGWYNIANPRYTRRGFTDGLMSYDVPYVNDNINNDNIIYNNNSNNNNQNNNNILPKSISNPLYVSLGNKNINGNNFTLPNNWNTINNSNNNNQNNKNRNFLKSPGGATIITGLGNALGWGATAIGNAIGAQHQKRGVNRAADAMVNAYDQLRGVDLNQLNGVYNHGVAALQDASTINAGAERAAIERSLQRNLRGINRGRLSSAAAQNLSANAETNAQDLINQAEAEAAKRRQVVANENQQAINDMTKTNLTIDAQRAQSINDLLKYNSEVANQRVLGIGQANADRYNQLGQIRSQRSLANWSGAGNVFTNTAQTYQNQINAYNTNRFNTLAALAGATQQETADRVIELLRQFGIRV